MEITGLLRTGIKTNLQYSEELLQGLPCGLHRATLREAFTLLPELKDLYTSSPITEKDYDEWEIDVKIHMLMKGQYPCIPNWHCDNVPRINGKLSYESIPTNTLEEPSKVKPMYLWLSGKPCTQFLRNISYITKVPRDHGELANIINRSFTHSALVSAPEQEWLGMYQNTPHRGTAATENTWRIFVRLTHSSMLSQRPVISKIRRHAQVYLPHDFHW